MSHDVLLNTEGDRYMTAQNLSDNDETIHSKSLKDSCLPPPAFFTWKESWNIKPVPPSQCPFLQWSINWYPSGQSSALIAASFSPCPIFRKCNQISSTLGNVIQNIIGLVSYRTSVKREQKYRLFALHIYSSEDQSNNWPWLGYYLYHMMIALFVSDLHQLTIIVNVLIICLSY